MVRNHDVTLVTRDQKDDSPMRQAKLMGCCDRSDKYRLHDELGVKTFWSFEEFTTRNQLPMPNALDRMTATTDEDETCRVVRDVIVKEGKLQFPLTLKTKNQIMIAFKELLSENRYFEESQRVVRTEADRRRTHFSKSKKERHANVDEDEEAINRAYLCDVESRSGTESPHVCRSFRSKKASMHANLKMTRKSIHALIDTGATDYFLQEESMRALGLASSMHPSDRHVVLAIGERERITGYLDVPAKLDGRPVNFSAYILRAKAKKGL